MGRTACTEPQCLYKGALYLFFTPNLTSNTNMRFSITDCAEDGEHLKVLSHCWLQMLSLTWLWTFVQKIKCSLQILVMSNFIMKQTNKQKKEKEKKERKGGKKKTETFCNTVCLWTKDRWSQSCETQFVKLQVKLQLLHPNTGYLS